MKIRLTKRLARFLNGIDLSDAQAGEVMDVSEREAALLVREGWAAPIEEGGTLTAAPHRADDTSRRSRKAANKRTSQKRTPRRRDR